MLFRKKIPRSCTYCIHGTTLNDEQVLCVKKGVVCSQNSCRHFSYEPCKRIPPRPKSTDFREFDKEDFTL